MRVRRVGRTVAVFILVWFGTSRAQAQIPAKFKNLRVLPKESSRAQVVETMRGFANALGVRCVHCHVGGNADTLEGVDFASDAKWEKRTARAMLRMVRAVNAHYIGRLETRPRVTGASLPPAVQVECVTCHRGVRCPETIETVLMRSLERDGPEAALKEYGDLRSKYLGHGSYDFSSGPLNMVAEGLLKAHRGREAVAVTEYNVESHPDASWSLHLLGEARLAVGDDEKALAAFERSLALDPGNSLTRRRVDELRHRASPKP